MTATRNGIWALNAVLLLLATAFTISLLKAPLSRIRLAFVELHEVRARSLDGADIDLLATQGSTILLVFSPSCPVCERVAPTWNDFIRGVADRHVHVRLVAFADESPDAIRSFLGRHELAAPVRIVDYAAFRSATGVSWVPTVLTVEATGSILFLKQGGDLPPVLWDVLAPSLE